MSKGCALTMEARYIWSLIFSLSVMFAYSQPPRRISVDDFLAAVSNHPQVIKHAQGLEEVRCSIEIARLSPDPTLTFGNMSGDVSGMNMPHQLFVGVDYKFETGGKRRARIRYAEAQLSLAKAEHDVFLIGFKSTALKIFQDCWMIEQRVNELRQFNETLLSLIISDSVQLLKRQLFTAETQLKLGRLQYEHEEMIAQLNRLVSHRYGDQPVLPETGVWSCSYGAGQTPPATYSQAKVAALKAELIKEEASLVASNSVGDISFLLGNTFVTRATNPEAPSPSYNAITAMATVPLKFSTLKREARSLEQLRLESIQHADLSATDHAEDLWNSLQRDIENLATGLGRINSMIGLQQKYLVEISSVASPDVLEALQQLQVYRDQSWMIFDQIAQRKAALFELSGTLNSDSAAPVAGIK